MALTVEDGTGLEDAESYVSVADVDAYITAGYAADSTAAQWVAAATGEKEEALRRATAYLDGHYLGDWKGTRNLKAQALAWPRTGGVDVDGYSIDSSSVPKNLEHAAAEVAIETVTRTSELDPAQTDPSTLDKELLKIGPITIAEDFSSPKSSSLEISQRFPKVDRLLTDLISSSNRADLG